MKNLKKLLAWMISLAMCFSILPAQASVPVTQITDKEEVTASEMEIEGSNSVGVLLADTLSEGIEQKTEQENEEYYISDLVVEGNHATVQYVSKVQADIVVAIYDEQTERMAVSAVKIVEGKDTVVSLVLEGEMPKYYIAAAYMLDPKTHAPLCDSYSTSLYTESLQQLENATIQDYEEELVLNLDENDSTNFVVYDKDTKIIDYQNGVNVVTDQENGSYMVTNADSSFQNLKPGDVVSYTDQNGELLIFKVKSVSMKSGAMTIQEDKDITLEDVFEDIKIEGGYADMEDPTPAVYDEGISPYSNRSIDTGVNVSTEKTFGPLEKVFKKENGKANVTIKASGTLSASAYIKLYLSKEKKYFETKVCFQGAVDVSISGSTGRQTFDLLPEHVELCPVPGVFITIMPSIIIQATMKLDFNATVTACIGAAYNGSSWQNKSERPKVSKCEIEAEGSLYLGFSLEPKVKILTDKVGDAKITAGYGATFSGTMDLWKAEKDIEHKCQKCLGGKMKVDINVGASATFLDHFKASMNLIKISFTPIDFYYSFDYKDWDFTTCPHMRYKITLTAKDVNGNLVSGAKVDGTCLSEAPVTGNDGKAEFYLDSDIYNLSVEKDNLKGTGTLKVKKEKQDITITLKAKVYKVFMNVKDSKGNPVSFAKIEGTGLDTDPLTVNGKAEFSLENGNYDLIVTKDGVSAKVKITVQGKDQNVVVNLAEAEVKITLTAKDSDGKPVSGAVVSGTGLGNDPVTDGNGMAEFYVSKGTYDLSVVKGNLSAKVNVVAENDSMTLNLVLKQRMIPEDAFEWNGHYYKLYMESMSWGAAQRACENIGGHLVAITSEEEQDSVYGYIKRTTSKDVDIMIGLNKSELGGWGTWVTGEAVTYSNWGNKQPDNLTGTQDTGVICTGIRDGGSKYYIKPGEWDDNNRGNYWYLCEWEPEALNMPEFIHNVSLTPTIQLEKEKHPAVSKLTSDTKNSLSSISIVDAAPIYCSDYPETLMGGKDTLSEFTGLVPGASYILLVMKNPEAQNILSPENLLYIYQQNADQNGKITLSYVPRTSDSAEVRAYGPEPGMFKDINSCTAGLSSDSYTYNGEARKPDITVKDASAILTEGRDYTVTYQDNINAGKASAVITGIGAYTGTKTVNFTIKKANNKIIASNIVRTASGKKQSFSIGAKAEGNTKLTYTVSDKSKVSLNGEGKVTIAKNFIGKVKITIISSATANYEKSSKQITITVKPAKVSLSSTKNMKGRRIKVKWKKNSYVSGYQIQYSTSKNFNKGVRKLKVSGAKKVTKDISGLKKGKKYYVRIRSYKKISKGTLYSDWSGIKKIFILK